MATAAHTATRLAYDDEGAGTPVVLLHGLTFDRRSWRPIIERLGGSVRSIAVDLPAHGESGGAPVPVEQVPARLHELLVSLEVERPIVVGHSMSGGLAALYASAYPTRGLVAVDNGPHIRPFAELVRRLEPALRGPGFAQVWPTFENSLGLERIPEPARSLVLATHEVHQDVVLVYWEMVLRSDPAELQAWMDTINATLDVPCLGVFGRPITDGERERFASLPDVQLEEWAGDGHFVHLVDPGRFATRLHQFVDRYWLIAPNPDQDPRAATAVETSLADGYAPGVDTTAPRTVPSRSAHSRRSRDRQSFQLIESKLHPPWLRPGMVARSALVERLLTTAPGAVVCVVAPPGYGKTTLLAQWAQRKGDRVGWVTVDPHDNDPAVLLTYLAVALDRVEPVDLETFQILASPATHLGPTVAPRLAAAMAAMTEPVALVLDQVELLHNRQCLDALEQFAMQLSSGSRLVLASRTQPRLPLGRLRGQGQLMEIGAADLAMNLSEARALLKGADLRLAAEHVAELHRRTEGWPTGLYLAALALQAGTALDTPAAGVSFAGDDRFIVDYLNSELLMRLPAGQVSFLTRTAVLDRMCGPLCDAVLDTTGSAKVLESLAGSNLLLVPLDRRREWYRYHHLFRDLLRAELERREPELIPELHRRAAVWCEANGLEETAIDHAQAAGDADQVGRLVLKVMQPVWASGRVDTVLRWMEWFEREQLMDRYPAVAVHGALIFALLGRATRAEHWAAAAERASPEGRLPDGSTMESYLAYLRAILCRDGVAEMRRDARLAWDGLSPLSPYRATMLHTEGLSFLLDGDAERADALFARAFEAASEAGAPPLAAVVLAERCIIAAARDDWAAAAALADRALEIIRGGQFDAYWTSALVYAWAARVALYRGKLNEARDHLARSAGLRPLLTHALPVVSVQALLELARAYIALGDPDGAHAVLRHADDIFQQRPNLGVLPAQANELRTTLATMKRTGLGASSLTTAELRLLPLLPSYLSFREIGQRLFVSHHTVKTQAISIYRKLGVSSRSEAVDHAQQLGLLGR